MTTRYIDGAKSILLEQYKPESWTWLSGGPEDSIEATASDYFATVPWLYRGVGLRANAVGMLPFDLIDETTGDVVDTSEDWQNILGFMPNPYRLFWLMEASAVLSGRAYLFRVANSIKTLDLKYIRPISVRPLLDESKGLTGFERTTGKQTLEYPYDPDNPLSNKIIYIWLEDPNVEIGEPTSYPAKAALSSAGVLFNVDEFLNAFIKRGMVKPSLISMKGNPPQAERDKTEAWFNKFMAGMKNAFRVKTVSADGVEVVTIGEGLAELGSTELTGEKREDISTALGIPQTILFSSGAGGLGGGGVVEQDDKRFYLTTAIPAWKSHAYELNRQLLIPLGYRMIERHQEMEMFQQDEKDSSAALVNLTSAVATDPEAALFSSIVLGVEIPDEAQELLDKIIARKEADRERMASIIPKPGEKKEEEEEGTPPTPELSPKRDPEEKRAMLNDLTTWKNRARKDLERNKDLGRPFESTFIPAQLISEIRSMLADAKTAADITTIFETVRNEQSTDYGGFGDLVSALRDATRELREKGTEDVS